MTATLLTFTPRHVPAYTATPDGLIRATCDGRTFITEDAPYVCDRHKFMASRHRVDGRIAAAELEEQRRRDCLAALKEAFFNRRSM